MALTDTAIRLSKPRAKPYKMADERGLHLLVTPAGGKLWRFRYRHEGREKLLAIGSYPDTTLKAARQRRDDARTLLEAGVDPATEKQRQKLERTLAKATTFEAVATEFIEKMEREGRAPSTIVKARWFLELLKPSLGARPIADILPQELLSTLKRVEARGRLETAQRLRAFAGRVFRYAVATSRATANPAAPLTGALTSPRVKHRAAILEPGRIGELLRAISGYEGQPETRLALMLAPHVFVRPGELRHAEWSEIDLDAAVWTIAADKMKMRKPHAVPLSRQSLAILREAHALTGTGRYVFPGTRTAARPISENTMTAALRRMGYTTEEMTPHGFRSIASTLLNESGKWSADAIERALAHRDSDMVRAAYHRGQHWQERVNMAQWWSDYLDQLSTGGTVLPMKQRGKPGP